MKSAAVAILFVIGQTCAEPVQLIIDTDLGFDVDDIGALAVAHHLQDTGLCEILGVVHNTAFFKGVGGVSTVDEFYDSRAALGAYTGQWGSADQASQDRYTSAILSNHPATVQNYDGVESAVSAYQRMLTSASNSSVVIASIGELTNLRDIIEADRELFVAKVRAVYFMDGSYNFGCGDSDGSGWSPWIGSTEDCDGAAQFVVESIPPSIKQVFSLNGGDVLTGSRYNGDNSCSAGPVKEAFQLWTNGGSRSSWDQLAVYYAVHCEFTNCRLYSTLYPKTVRVNYYGRETYGDYDSGLNHHQVWLWDDRIGDATKVLDDMMCAAPCRDDGIGGCAGYGLNSGRNCYGDRDGQGSHGATDLESPADSAAPGSPMTLHACQQLCDGTDGCEAVTVRHSGQAGLVDCFRKGELQMALCDLDYPSPFDTWKKK